MAEQGSRGQADSSKENDQDGNAPHGNAPHGNAPHGNAPHGNAPHGNAPHGDASRTLADDVARLRARLRGEALAEIDTGGAVFSARLQQLCNQFGLSIFECHVLLLCVAMVLDSEVATECRGPQKRYPAFPSFGLAMATLPGPHWSAISPSGPLRAWRMIELADEYELSNTRLYADERIVHHLMGLDPLDARLMPYSKALLPSPWLPDSFRQLADHMRTALMGAAPPLIRLSGRSPVDVYSLAATVCEGMKRALFAVDCAKLPSTAQERDNFYRLWKRENRLLGRALLLVADDSQQAQGLDALTDAIHPLFLLGDGIDKHNSGLRPVLNVTVPPLPFSDQVAVMKRLQGEKVYALFSQAHSKSAGHFRLGLSEVVAAASQSQSFLKPQGNADAALWDACREQCRPRLATLAQEIHCRANWDDLVLPAAEKQILANIALHLRHAHRVYEQGGFGEKTSRGLGITALFHGDSGTGKTFAAEVLAKQFHLSLFRIDLSTVVSKYIGETEKNLRAIFDAADSGGAVLLFDEADALFGKRSEVHDSHDRYANIEVGYLLSRLESFQGLAILTTNMKQSLDKAFLRRIRFVVEFPFPGLRERADIWRRAFPEATATADLDWARLAKLNVAGGNIRNIALAAAFLAADAEQAVAMDHIYSAARAEYAKLERLLTSTELGG